MGIFVCLISYGYFQELIMTGTWGNDKIGGTQISSLFLVMCNRITSMGIAVLAIMIKRDTLMPAAPLTAYCAIAFSNMMATTCQYEALRYVSFPTQTLGKTAKMIPVMIWGTLLSTHRYKLKDYLVAAGVTTGTTLFLLTGPVSAKHSRDSRTTAMGAVIMAMYLFFDGFTSTVQERLFKDRKVSTWNQMLYVGLLSALIFILLMIRDFGALLFATVMTTRQFLSILLSCIIFLHPLSGGQWVGTCLVFGSLYWKTLVSMPGNKKEQAHHQEEGSKEEGENLMEKMDDVEANKHEVDKEENRN
ncbi:hypothetical protein GUITHDRAFT_110561 [Guillardia theta CCMP2712]|uniref:Uncharacterized protein n=1 Tax=Guillardia theta (strain CCMP2712) TaxID=905079 RepID=L1J5P0_GUITC|nr:hypothetical protein GUITHDRAFT_110561 [Guillardia theta CCMP2712]EKX43439.1 hypothetical protein GUITHDRAFT_110561 [Guillardia theta CCMP2712]|eukprot:XP_005830419.1 hypothetical protein GUITHDRAFT_110561 [Guillardia theta CCMP2712]